MILPVECVHCGEMITKRGLQKDSLLMGNVDGKRLPSHKGCYYTIYNPMKKLEYRKKVSKSKLGKKRPDISYRRMSDNELAVCPYCQMGFNSQWGLRSHIGQIHMNYPQRSVTPPIKCTYCGEMIIKHGLQKGSLVMGNIDGDKKPFHRRCYFSVYAPFKRPEVVAKVRGKPRPNTSEALRGKPRPWQVGDKNVSKRPEVRKILSEQKMGDKNPMRDPKNLEIWRKAMSKIPNKPEFRLIPILEEFGFIYHGDIEIPRAPDFIHEDRQRVIEYDGFGGHSPTAPWTPDTWEECLALDDKRDQEYRDAGYYVLRIFPEDLAEGDDFVRGKVVEWMLQ